MSRIQTLPILLANQIAAGEVIERPAHVVKELVENSLDAGSRRIVCAIQGGGIQQIRVSDDGVGIHPEDLTLSLMAHATSKIRAVSDLMEIASLGFRGEALASIASIAKLRIESRLEHAAQAYALLCEGGQFFPIQESLRLRGTQVCVEDLFFNVLARRRFLKSTQAEGLDIQDMMMHLALSHFGVEWVFEIDGETKWILPALSENHPEQAIQRFRKLWGKRFVEDATYVCEQGEGWCLKGWLGGRDSGRSDRLRQYLYLNGRVVRDPFLQRILRMVYEPYVPTGRFPMYALYLEWPLADIDVNVHPTKHAVRFHDPKGVQDRLLGGLSQALRERELCISGPPKSVVSLGVGGFSQNDPSETPGSEPCDSGYALQMINGQHYLVDAHAYSALSAFELWQAEGASNLIEAGAWDLALDERQIFRLQETVLNWAVKGFLWDLSVLDHPKLLQYPRVLSSINWSQLQHRIAELLSRPFFPEQTFESYFCCDVRHQLPDDGAERWLRFLGGRCRHGRHAVVHVEGSCLEGIITRGRF